MSSEHESRRLRLAGALATADLDTALVTDLVNIRHLTGFTGSSAVLAVSRDGSAEMATDSRYALQVREECADVPAHITRGGLGFLADRMVAGGANAAGFEDLSLSVASWRALPAGLDWRSLGSMVTRLRMTKDASELRLLRAACGASDAALAVVLPRIRPGVTEREVARWLDDALRDRSEGPGFDTIVAAGSNGAIPHHQPTDQPLVDGDLVTMDFGARVGGYHADMTRTVSLGRAVDWQREIYEVVRAAQSKGVAALAPGLAASEVDAMSRAVIVEAGYGDYFGHGLGHGVGLQIHEAPFLGATSADKLSGSVPVTVEPGVYLPERGGVRIEDTVVVHADHVECLTTTTRDLLVVG